MGRWTIKPWALTLLLGMLFLFFLILVLPDVDLPDVAFNGGSAPVVAHARSVSTPGVLTVGAFTEFSFSSQFYRHHHTHPAPFLVVSVDSLPILHRSLRC